jgi:RNA polymerase sigma-70 factor, ECF subfamily
LVTAPPDATDEDLMRAYQEGDLTAFNSLYRRYSGKVYGFLVRRLPDRETAGDLFQASFLKLHEARHRYDPAYPFAPWLFTIARNLLTDHYRKRGTAAEVPLAGDEPAAERSNVDLPSLSSLNETQREAIRLRYGEDLRFDEIARKLETSPANVRQLVSRGIRKLRGGG